MSDTPQTDQAEASALEVGQWHLAKLCRQLERENAALRKDKARLEYLSERWNPTSDLWNDQIGKWMLSGDHDRMIKAIDAARKEAQP